MSQINLTTRAPDFITCLHETKDARLLSIILESWVQHAAIEAQRRQWLLSQIDETIDVDLFGALLRLRNTQKITLNDNLIDYDLAGLQNEGHEMTLNLLYSAKEYPHQNLL